MSLSKQLYIIISIIFLMIFTGNFIITVKNTKDYLIEESSSKSQDAATSLGMMLKSLISNKKDPEIISTINAIADSGFYRELRLEDAFYTFSDTELISLDKNLKGLMWNIKNVHVDKKLGKIIVNNEQNLENELDALEDDTTNTTQDDENIEEKTYTFMPSKNFKDNSYLTVYFTAISKTKTVKTNVKIKLSKILYQTKRPVKFDNVPEWFIKLINIHLKEASSDINDGWKTTAVIYVSANPGIAYEKLYIQAKSAVIYSAVAFVIAMTLLAIFINLILNSLKRIEKLANNISSGSFEQIENIPWTKELRTVSIAMNTMSSKIKNIINNLNKSVANISVELTLDPLTKLESKETFQTDIKEMFISKTAGYVYLVQIDDLATFAKDNGRFTVDNFLKEFAEILKKIPSGKGYRFYGSQFALITKNTSYEDVKKLAKDLKKSLEELGKKYNKNNVANIGAVPFDQYGTLSTILTAADEAYIMAKQIGPNEMHIKDQTDIVRGMLQWKELVFDVIDNKNFDIIYIQDTYNLQSDTKQLLMQEAFAKLIDKDGEDVPIGIFISVAQDHNKIIDFDKAVVENIVEYIAQNNIQHEIAINLAIESVKDMKFIIWLENLIKQYQNISQYLVFSLTAYNIAKYKEEFKHFTNIIHNNNAKVMIKRFDLKFIELEKVNEVNPDCIRLARDYTNNISADNNKKTIVENIVQLSELIEFELYAENVENDDDFALVKELGVYGASR